MSKTTSFFDFAKIENDNENKLKVSDGMMLATGLAGDQPVIGYSTDEVKKIVENYKSGLSGLPGNWQVGVAGQVASSLAGATTAATGQTVDIDTGSDVGALSVGGTVGGIPGAGATAAGAPITISGTDTGKLEFDAWKAQYGVDTDKNFQDSVSRLDYEMKTWAANYGANAERLARMGLSNSGMVDIYGTGVVQAYLQSMNDLYLAKAEGDRQNAEAYKKYSDEYEADLAARTEAKNNNILAAYNYGLGIYNGSNLNEVTTMIRNAGYDEDVITEAVTRLGAVDASMLPALQAQAQQDQTDINTAIDQLIKSGYTADMAESAAELYRAQGWSEEKIAKLIQGVNGLAGMAPKVDKVKEKYAQIISSESGYKSSMDGQLSQMLSVAEGWSEEEINELLGYLHDFEAAGQSGAGDQNLIAGVEAVNQMLAKANVAYDGSEELKTQIKQQLRNGEYEAIADQIIAQLDADLAEVKGAAAADAVKKIEESNVKDLSVSGMASDLDEAATKYGVDSEEYAKVQKAYSDKIVSALTDVFEYDSDLEPLGSLIGVDGEQWATMDDSDKVGAIFNELGKLHKDGHMTDEAYYSMTDKLVENEMEGVLSAVGKTSFRELADVLLTLRTYMDSKYIDQQKYNEYRNKLTEAIDNIEAIGKSDQHGTYPRAEFALDFGGKTFKLTMFANETPVSADEYAKLNEYRGSQSVFEYNGDLYAWIPGSESEVRGYTTKTNDAIYKLNTNVSSTGSGQGSSSQIKAMRELIWNYIKNYDE